MSWCLECHRSDDKNLVPPERVTDLKWVEDHLQSRDQRDTASLALAKQLVDGLKQAPPQNCGACHY
jgi:mono/diheme cytochrome c family protein